MRLRSISLFAILSWVTLAASKRQLKVLVYSPSLGYSHMQFQGTLADLLVDAGHEVHVLIPDRVPSFTSNGTQKAQKVIRFPVPQAEADEKEIAWANEPFSGWRNVIFDGTAKQLGKTMLSECQDVLENDAVFDFLKTQQYDVAIAEAWQICPFSLFHALNIPTRLGSHAVPLSPQLGGILGIPSPASFVPFVLTTFIHGDQMPYLERLRNFSYRFLDWLAASQFFNEIDRLYRAKYGKDFPGVRDLVANISLAFVHANPFFDLPRPISHKTVYIGGIVKKEPKPLSLELQDIYSRARQGVVLFSFGSIIETTKMPTHMIKAFFSAFAKFPEYQFIWKCRSKGNYSKIVPKNVHFFEWVDQVSVLAHAKSRAFITHCGMNSINEAATHGVPVVAIPLVADQFYNAAIAVKYKTGVYVDVSQITKEVIEEALEKVLNDPSYRERALTIKKKIVSSPFRASETFVKWTEFAAEHQDLSELQLASVGMNDFVYHSLDAISALVALAAFLIAHLLLPVMNPEMPFHGNDQVSKVFRPSMNHSAEIVEKMRTLSCMEAPFSGIQNMLLDGFHYTWREIDNLGLYDLVNNDELMRQLESERYDIGIGETISALPFGLFHALGIRTTFGGSALPLIGFMKNALGLPTPSSFMQDPIATVSVNGDEMTLWERASNAFFTAWWHLFHDVMNHEQHQILNDKYDSNFPSVQSVLNNISFYFVNSNPLLDLPQVTTPKHVAGIFEKPSKGVILFSFGTIVNETRLTAVTRQAILDAFSEFPDYEFIWKNSAVDAHPRLSAFITHCGLNSLNEAAASGVPLVTIPLFADQLYNSAIVKKRGIGTYLDIRYLTKEALVDALRAVLEDPSYRDNARLLKRKLETYPHDPAELFLRHIEFASEFGPLQELSLASAEMPLYKYYNVDVLALVLTALEDKD
ncbi:CRE-UGT-15 protein [Aphelenchoides avenae]|nr:CRE-UGT-15 protein [Aphelenchus avenae]